MRYRCTKCGSKCTVSVLKNVTPTRCPIADRDAEWVKERDAASTNPRMTIIRKAMIRDAKGEYVQCIDPSQRHNDRVYASISEASEETGVQKGSISRSVKSQGRLKGGEYYWKSAPMSMEQVKIKVAAQEGIEAYREALKEYAPERYVEIFGEE